MPKKSKSGGDKAGEQHRCTVLWWQKACAGTDDICVFRSISGENAKKKKRDEFFLYGEQAEELAKHESKQGFIVNVGIEIGKKTVPSYLIPDNHIAAVLNLWLFDQGKTVRMYERDSAGKWRKTKHGDASQVRQFQEIIFRDGIEVKNNNCYMAVRVQGNKVGVAMCDTVLNKMYVSEFEDDRNSTVIHSIIVSFNPVLVLMLKGGAVTDAFQNAYTCLTNFGVNVEERKVKKDLVVESTLYCSILKKKQHARNLLRVRPLADKCVVALMDHGNLTASQNMKFFLEVFNPDKIIHLDHSAQESLNLFPDPKKNTKKERKLALVNILDNTCARGMGKRLLMSWLRQPSRDSNLIRDRQNIVELFSDARNYDVRDSVQQLLKETPDIERLNKKLESGKIKPKELLEMYSCMCCMEDIIASLKIARGPHSLQLQEQFTKRYEKCFNELHNFGQLIMKVFDLEDFNCRRRPRVKPTFDEKLHQIHIERTELERRWEEHLEEVRMKFSDTGKTKIVKTDDLLGRKCFRCTTKGKSKCYALEKKEYLEILKDLKNKCTFLTPKGKEISELLEAIEADYNITAKAVIQKTISVAQTFCVVWDEAIDFIPKLDVLISFSVCTTRYGYVRPKVMPEGSRLIDIKGAKHPCISIDNEDFIPNDILMDDSCRFQIITGPNMGGKSTYCRTAALHIIMSCIGCFIPAEEATITIVDAIRCRIGAGDRMGSGISTFMAEMLDVSAIIEASTSNTLVIIDELGRGTSTSDGYGIARAVIQHIAGKLKCFSFFATHFHELCSLGEDMEGIANRHVAATVGTDLDVTMQYVVRKGPCLNSYGVHIAAMAQFPDNVVKAARKKTGELEGDELRKAKQAVLRVLESIKAQKDAQTEPLTPEQKEAMLARLKKALVVNRKKCAQLEEYCASRMQIG